jgi:DNA (cytosine-5)-methyltransferase 1
LGDTKDTNRRGEQPASAAGQRWSGFAGASLLGSFWSDAEWIYCRDHKWRPAKSGIFPLASGVPARVVRLRGYGNSIKPPVAAAFIEAYMSTANV